MVFGSLIGGILGSVGGSILQDRADKRTRRDQLGQLARAESLLEAGETRASEFLRQALEAVDAAGAQALGQTANAEFQANRALGDQFQQAQGGLTQNLASRGLYNSTVATSAQSGLLGQYGRGLGQIGAQFGGLRSQIAMNTGNARAGIFSSQASNAAQFATNRANLVGNVQFQGPQGLAQNFGTLGSALGGAFDAWGSWAQKRKSPGGPAGVASNTR